LPILGARLTASDRSLTGVDEVLVGDAGVVDIVYSTRYDHAEHLEISERVLTNTASLQVLGSVTMTIESSTNTCA